MTMHRLSMIPLVLLLAGCTLFGSGSSGDVTELADARSRWESLGWSDYDIRLFRGCFCVGAGEFEVWVRDDERAAVWPAGEFPTEIRSEYWEHIPTIDDLFDLIAHAQREADEVSVTYDERGWPTTIDIDWISNAVDDEIGYTVESVTEAVPGDPVTLAPGDTYQRAGTSVRFDEVTQDSRCPVQVTCIWAGQATARFTITVPGEGTFEVLLTDPPHFDGDQRSVEIGPLRITLLAVEPYPQNPDEPIAADEYRARVLFETL